MLGPASTGYKIPQRIEGEKTQQQHIRAAGDNRDSIPGVAGGTGTGKPQRPQKGVGTEGEKVGQEEQEQWQILHTHIQTRTCTLSQLRCVH